MLLSNWIQKLAITAILGSTLLMSAAGEVESLDIPSNCAAIVEEDQIVLRGNAKVEDADTIWVGIHKVRLYGIEALEDDQPCTKNGERFYCAEKSIKYLTELVEGIDVTCRIDIGKRGEPVMSYNRYLGTCTLPDQTSINQIMVGEGWALADP